PNAVLALEHAGLGHKSLVALDRIRPGYVKLDRRELAGIAADRARQAQLETLVRLAEESATQVMASGVEADEERETLCRLGVPLGQGYLLGRPRELADTRA
ncbi:MAG: EAL domain-containing protein, partial [Acidimicrobiales bacterium]